MKTKKKNKESVQGLKEKLGDGGSPSLEMPRGRLQATAKELLGAGRAMVKRAPQPAHPVEVAALEGVEAACDDVEEALAHNAAIEPPAVREKREDVVVRATSIKTTVGRWASSGTSVAPIATDLQRKLFPEGTFRDMPQHTLWQVLAQKQRMLEEDAELSAALEVFVPEPVTAELFAANDALGKALPTGEVKAPIDQRMIGEHLQRRLVRYAAAVIATADPADAEAVKRAQQALQPLEELRVELRARLRRVRSGKAKARAEASAVKPASAPVVTAPVLAPPARTDDDSG